MRFIFLFFILVFANSCRVETKEEPIPTQRATYRSATGLVSDSLKAHFYNFGVEDRGLTCSVAEKHNIDSPLHLYNIHLNIDLDSLDYKEKFEILKHNIIYTYSNKDSLKYDIIATAGFMPIVYNVLDTATRIYPKEKIKRILSTFGNKQILPYFRYYTSDENKIFGDRFSKTGLKDNCTIHILKYGLHNVMPQESILKNEWLPEKAKHGYITGFITQEGSSIVNLWTCVW